MKHNVTKPRISLLLAAVLLLHVMAAPVFATPTQDLWNAIMTNDLEAAKTALGNGADINALAPECTDEIDEGMKTMSLLMLTIAAKASPESIQFLLDNGVNIQYQIPEGDVKGASALFVAEYVGRQDVAELLKEAGAALTEEEQSLMDAFMNESKMSETNWSMRFIEERLDEFWEKYKFFPKAPEEKDIREVLDEIEKFRSEKESMVVGIDTSGIDGWGTSIKYVSDGTSYTLTSYGADNAKGGDDDMVISKQKEAPAEEGKPAQEELSETGTFEKSGLTFKYPASWKCSPSELDTILGRPGVISGNVYEPAGLKYMGLSEPEGDPVEVLKRYLGMLGVDTGSTTFESSTLDDARKMVSCIVKPASLPELLLFAVELGNGEVGIMRFISKGDEPVPDEVKAIAPKMAASFKAKS